MSTVTNTNGVLDTSLLSSLNGSKSTSSSTSAADKTQANFLNLLVTQLKNQDPLNPMDNAQMTSQLAQINTVDGISKLNATLQTLLSNSVDNQALQAASLVGQHVLVTGGTIQQTQDQPSLSGVELSGPADKVVATIKDSNGLTVRTLNLGSMAAGTNTFAWDGNSDSGTPVATGAYSLSLAATQGTNNVTATALQVGTVSSVARTTSGVSINVGSLGAFTTSAIKQIL